ncbi:uncharacterized protein [Chelonus insularis]|uniref:uncharacterized protein n=1 Tax=Chelonus insularis TaxID=460826 RepID=UPI00158EF259|nr:uncharacterized protein LOC118066296 [Chelonus insularis]
MTSKGFCVKIYFDLNVVSCPGVWLCPNGTVALRINCLDAHIESRKIPPQFPLTFEDKFLFKKTFTDVGTLSQLQYSLEDEILYAELIQRPSEDYKGVILATFETNLADLLYPAPCFKGLVSGIDVDLLMEPSKYFPGILAPKIEISTRTVIEEVELCNVDMIGMKVISPKLINSRARSCLHRKRPSVGIIRQKRVCHSQTGKKIPSHRCGCGHDIHTSPDEVIVSCPSNQRAHTHQCYHQNGHEELKCTYLLPCQASNMYSSQLRFHDFDDCPVCSRYKHFFAKETKSNATYSIRSNDEGRKEGCNGRCSNCPKTTNSDYTKKFEI